MQSSRWMIVAVILVVAACSSSGDPMAVEFRDPLDEGPARAEVVGAAVDDGMLCPEGAFTTLRMENADGELVSDEEGAREWDEALETGATLHMTLYEEFNCADGSGSLSVVVDNVVQPSALDFEGTNDVGTWEIEGGTGSYEGFSGEGDYVADFGNGRAVYSGEIREG